MAYKQILGLILVCLFISCNYRVNGEGEQTAREVGRDNRNRSRIMFPTLGSEDDNNADPIVHKAYYYTKFESYHGSRARISVWGLQNVSNNAESSVAIVLYNGQQMMGAGFHVSPGLYGDQDLHFFTLWTSDGFKTTGCVNTKCPGFVLSNVTDALVPGGRAQPLSTYDGTNYFYTVSIKKDETTGDWSLYRDDGGPILCGWWPKTLFTDLADKATEVQWGGHVVYPKNEAGPPMGSGYFPDENKKRSAYVSHIKLFNTHGDAVYPQESAIGFNNDRGDCYDLHAFKNAGDHGGDDGYIFFYGGPSGCTN